MSAKKGDLVFFLILDCKFVFVAIQIIDDIHFALFNPLPQYYNLFLKNLKRKFYAFINIEKTLIFKPKHIFFFPKAFNKSVLIKSKRNHVTLKWPLECHITIEPPLMVNAILNLIVNKIYLRSITKISFRFIKIYLKTKTN